MKKRLTIIVVLVVVFLIGVTVGAVIAELLGVINLSYTIKRFFEPTVSGSPALEPNPLNLDLGTITAVLEGNKWFPSVATLTVPEKCEVTATLDPSSASDFDEFEVQIRFNSREIDYTTSVYVYPYDVPELWSELCPDTTTLYAGTYDVDVFVMDIRAKNVTATGTIVITLSVSR